MDLKLTYPPKKGKNATHFFMDGGTLHVPQDKFSAFNAAYMEAVADRSQKICLVEKCNPSQFVFFVDLDYKAARALDRQDVEDLSTNISRILGIGHSLVMVSQPRTVDEGLIKSGVHIVWPDQHVGVNEAMQFRAKLIEELPTGTKWADVLDKSVYRGGLRLPWSWKYQGGKHELPYLPMHIVNKDHTIRHVDAKPDQHLLKLASIIVPGQKREGWFSRDEMAQEITDTSIYGSLEEFIKYNIPRQQYAKIKNIWKQGDTDYWLVNTNSRYCENKGTAHGGNHIYFVIDGLGKIYQKCHCKCDHKERRFGICSEYKGKKYRLPGKIYKELFPNR